MNNSVEKLVKDLNEFSHRNNFEVPVLDGFEKIKTNGDNIIFSAKSKENFIESLIEDRKLSSIEDVKSKIASIIKEMQKFFKQNGAEIETAFYKELVINSISYYVYIQKTSYEKNVNMQISAYFLEPNSKFLYQFSILSPTFDKNVFDDKAEMELTFKLIKMIEAVLPGIKFV